MQKVAIDNRSGARNRPSNGQAISADGWRVALLDIDEETLNVAGLPDSAVNLAICCDVADAAGVTKALPRSRKNSDGWMSWSTMRVSQSLSRYSISLMRSGRALLAAGRRWLCHAQSSRRTTVMLLLTDRHEIAQVSQFHFDTLSLLVRS
jgi:hypothetical protein